MKAKKGRGLLRYLDGFWRQSILAPLFKLLEALFDLLVPLVVAEIINVGINRGDGLYPALLRPAGAAGGGGAGRLHHGTVVRRPGGHRLRHRHVP